MEKPDPSDSQSINIIALLKGSDQRYVFLYDDDPRSIQKLHETFGAYASNPELDLSWYDAAILSQRARQVLVEQQQNIAQEKEKRRKSFWDLFRRNRE